MPTAVEGGPEVLARPGSPCTLWTGYLFLLDCSGSHLRPVQHFSGGVSMTGVVCCLFDEME